MIAVCLLTCGRLDYTRKTLESFTAQNQDARERCLLLHADDASDDQPTLEALVKTYGFETVVIHSRRKGRRLLAHELIEFAASRGAEWIILLENDWESVRPLPWPLLDYVITTQPKVYTIRLYGQYKGRNGQFACALRHLGLRGRPAVTWAPLEGAPERAEIARIHWGAPPSLTRLAELRQLYKGASEAIGRTSKELTSDLPEIEASGKLAGLVVRVCDNVVYHIGQATTSGLAPKRQPHVTRRIARPQRYTPAWQAQRRKYAPGAVACLERALDALGQPRSLLDVGCGEGALVTRAQSSGIEAVGVDVSLPAEEGSLRHADLREPLDLGRTFDLVTSWEVAEHIPPESAETLCDSLVRQITPGGVLLFTAARPGQGGDGHLNEQPQSYWRDLLTARGLVFDAERTASLAKRFSAVAPRNPWYGQNLQVLTAPGDEAIFRQPERPRLPRVAITMRTADRSPKPNYVGGTIARLLAQGIDPKSINLCATNPNVAWLKKQLDGADVTLHVPHRTLTPNENGLQQIRVLDPALYDWVLLLEDDLAFCRDFLPSVKRWLSKARADRHVFRFFGFRVNPPSRHVSSYDWKLQGLCGSQAVALRMSDALDFLHWADDNLETWGSFRGNAKIAFDKLIAAWALKRWPHTPGVVSQPLFVRHIGDVSSIHPRAARNDALFAGEGWSYLEAAS